MSEQHSPAAFAAVLTDPSHPLIVGGQAVNLWAEIYVSAEPELHTFEPFTSKVPAFTVVVPVYVFAPESASVPVPAFVTAPPLMIPLSVLDVPEFVSVSPPAAAMSPAPVTSTAFSATVPPPEQPLR